MTFVKRGALASGFVGWSVMCFYDETYLIFMNKCVYMFVDYFIYNAYTVKLLLTTTPIRRPPRYYDRFFFGTDFFLLYSMVINSDSTTTPLLRITTSYPDQIACFEPILTPIIRPQLFILKLAIFKIYKFCNIDC